MRQDDVSLRIEGDDGFVLDGVSHMREISRDPLGLVRQASQYHQYPDGFMLFLGTMFSSTQDRAGQGSGFTHRQGDVVRLATPRLGARSEARRVGNEGVSKCRHRWWQHIYKNTNNTE